MGEIVFWTIIRTAISIPVLWILQSYVEPQVWWTILLFTIYGVIIHPTIIHYRLFEEKNKDIIESTLCSTCSHFDKTAVLCLKYDEHPTRSHLPCQGIDWHPVDIDNTGKDIYS